MNSKILKNIIEFRVEWYMQPISPGKPCGKSFRYENEYDEIILALKRDDPNLEQGVWKKDLKKSNWPKIIDICDQLLKTKTKDLQIASWFTLALTQQFGIIALPKGLDLIYKLSVKFWEASGLLV